MFYEPVTICKGEHTFCRACLSREIDAHKCCPLDRNPITFADPVPATQIQARVDDLLAATAKATATDEAGQQATTSARPIEDTA